MESIIMTFYIFVRITLLFCNLPKSLEDKRSRSSDILKGKSVIDIIQINMYLFAQPYDPTGQLHDYTFGLRKSHKWLLFEKKGTR